MDITSYLLGKQAGGGGGGSTLQNDKEVTITSNGTTVVNPDEGYDGLKKATITTNVQPNLETQTVTISTNTTTTITPTQGKDGLSSVSVITNVPTPGVPTKGIILDNWNSDGYPTTITVVGMTEIPNYYFAGGTDYMNFLKNASVTLPNNLTSIGIDAFRYLPISQMTLPNTLTTIKNEAFQYCKYLTSITIPNSVTTLGNNVFEGCTGLINVTLPSNLTTLGNSVFASDNKLETINLDNLENITSIGNYAFNQCQKLVITKTYATTLGNTSFGNCRAIKKLCLPNLQTVRGDNYSYASFSFCAALKQVWIGANITNAGLNRYPFNGCNVLEKIYINLPRATVQTMVGYDYAFINDASKVGMIVCNDDPGFITEAEFDALVVN